jgi:predicted metalloprotease with PDZ domain
MVRNAIIDELKSTISTPEQKLQEVVENKAKGAQVNGELKRVLVKCRQLIALSIRRIGEDHLIDNRIVSQPHTDSTTIGVAFDEKLGDFTIDNVLVGGPAFKSRKIEKGDVMVAIDGQAVNSSTIIAALQGAPRSSVTLTLQKRGTGRVEEITLERMSTSLITDNRRMFENFIKMRDRFTRSSDHAGVKHVEETIALWRAVMIEAQDHTNM